MSDKIICLSSKCVHWAVIKLSVKHKFLFKVVIGINIIVVKCAIGIDTLIGNWGCNG